MNKTTQQHLSELREAVMDLGFALSYLILVPALEKATRAVEWVTRKFDTRG